MKELLLEAGRLLKSGEALVLVSVVSGTGSAPRGAGAKMLVRQDGTTMGTVGGGAVEYEAGKTAMEAMEGKRSFTRRFNLVKGESEVGMICGGGVNIYFQYVHAGDQAVALCEEGAAACERDEDSWLITDLTEADSRPMEIYRRSGKEGGDFSRHLPVGPRAMEIREGERILYSEPLGQTGLVYIFGGGHVAQELVPLLAHLNFKCVVFDDRAEFTDRNLFPQAVKTVLGDFGSINSYLEIREADYVVIMTRGHQYDYVVQKQVLHTKAHYIGVMGSKKKLAALEEKLAGDGFTREDLKRFYGPIGTPISAETPAEIAVSVAGEMIGVRAKREGRQK